MSGIYIHIPFCKQACSYCDFYFVTRREMKTDFVDRLCEEIDQYKETRYTDEVVRTIYLGGGTPSLLSPNELEKIFEHLQSVFRLEPNEITMELNPDDVNVEYLSDIRSIGVGRASMGVQSFDPDRLRFMNRAHNPKEAIQALEYLGKAGFDIFTVDLIYGNPGQSLEDLELDINRLLEFDPPHISAYSLTIEPKTRLGKLNELGRLDPADDDLVAAHFDLIGRMLSEKGIERYEISNYSKSGFEAIHNTHYWRHENYLGLGPSAHSFWWNKDSNGGRRWEHARDLRLYLSEPFEACIWQEEVLALETLAEERLMLALRTRRGVDPDELYNKYSYIFNAEQWQWMELKSAEGLLESDNNQITLTDAGLQIADHLIAELISRG